MWKIIAVTLCVQKEHVGNMSCVSKINILLKCYWRVAKRMALLKRLKSFSCSLIKAQKVIYVVCRFNSECVRL